ncbi:OmpA family protein [Roseovarius dicentrarchi]|uniref:OmpA family protein n=1 Tax=Roseovarius dicentrarchi TaxID=2250573 RepID=UPI000DEA6B94|nr:OmpA family protein [Roseovarius dicentrarchi]
MTALVRSPALIAAVLATFAAPLAAQELALPANAMLMREAVDDSGGHAVPTGPWSEGTVPTQAAQGRVTRQAWRIAGAPVATPQLTDTLAAQLDAAGYSPIYRCASAVCGGFDFRFALTVLPPPEMFVDLFDYHYLSARKPSGDQDAYVTLLVSRSGTDTYVQITRISPGTVANRPPAAAPPGAAPVPSAPLVQALTQRGHAVLPDLDFATGADTLGPGPFTSLTALASFLKAGSDRRIALVGHTDTVGGLAPNLALSRRRAQAVMQRLIDAHGVAPAQLEADGIAYLSPTAPNTTDAGREANRRVEAVLLSGG